MGKISEITAIFLMVAGAAFAQNWKMVWNDEFSTPGLPDASKWGYDVGGGGWGNNELEYYTNARLENASVADGVLSITARKESYEGSNYTSVRMTSAGKGDWLYGKVVARAKLPRSVGIWPAIWLLPTDWEYGGWPNSGELDLMENVGYDSTRIYSTIHAIGMDKGGNTALANPWDDWHEYRMEWFADSVCFYVDDTQIFVYQNAHTGYETWPFDKRFHLLLNIAVGGNWGGAKGFDDSRYPQTMQVDYVRVYQNDESCTVASAPSSGELVWNGNFDCGSAKWNGLGAYNGATAHGSVEDGEYHVHVGTAGPADWAVQLSQAGLAFENGKTYQVTFTARASSERMISVAGNQDKDPWTTYGKDSVKVTTEPQTYSVKFTMAQPTDESARVEFDLGGSASDVWIDNVSVREAESSEAIVPSKRTLPRRNGSAHKYDLLGRTHR